MSTGNDRARSRNPSGSRVAETLADPNSKVEELQDSLVLPLQEHLVGIPGGNVLPHPQIAPGKRERMQTAEEGDIRQMMRRQSIRCWWNLLSQRYKAEGVANKLLRELIERGFPGSPTVSADGIPLASPEYDVVTDPVAERSLWDTWGRDAWLRIVASEQHFIVHHGFIFEMSRVQFEFDLSLFAVPPSRFANVFPL